MDKGADRCVNLRRQAAVRVPPKKPAAGGPDGYPFQSAQRARPSRGLSVRAGPGNVHDTVCQPKNQGAGAGGGAGRRCYELFYRRDVPCENCVLEGARDAGQCTREIYNPYLGLWLLADASMVDWDRRKACLVSCRNISPYMPPDGGRAPAFIDSPDGGWDG